MNGLVGKAIEQCAIERRTHALASAAGVKRDAYLNGLPEGFVVSVALCAGVTQDQIGAPGNEEPIGAG